MWKSESGHLTEKLWFCEFFVVPKNKDKKCGLLSAGLPSGSQQCDPGLSWESAHWQVKKRQTGSEHMAPWTGTDPGTGEVYFKKD